MVVTADLCSWTEVHLECANLPIPLEDACERLTARICALPAVLKGMPESAWPKLVVVDDRGSILSQKPEVLDIGRLFWTIRAQSKYFDDREWLEHWMKAQLELAVNRPCLTSAAARPEKV